MTLFDFHEASEHAELGQTLRRVQPEAQFESRWKRQDGTYLDVQGSTSIVDFESRLTMAVIRDITERKRHLAEIQDSEKQFRAIFDYSLDGMMLTSTDGTVFRARAAACRMYGRSEEEICRLGWSALVDTSDETFRRFMEERKRRWNLPAS